MSIFGQLVRRLNAEGGIKMKELTVFNYGTAKVRVVHNGEIHFVAKDVCAVLGYSNSKDAIIRHCKYGKILKGRDSLPLTDSPRGISVIPESDVYRSLCS